MNLRLILLVAIGILFPAQLSRAQETEPAPAQQQQNVTPLQKICEILVVEGQQVESLLSTIADKESADRAAARLEQLFQSMSARLRQLPTMPVSGDEDVLIIKTHMTALTHISQSCLTMLRRIYEVDAYGSEQLMQIIKKYGMGTRPVNELHADDLPHTQLYNELSDVLEDVLFALRKITDEASAAKAIKTVRELTEHMERTKHRLTLLDPPRTDDQREAVQPAKDRLLHLREELLSLRTKLQSLHDSSATELMSLLDRLLVASAG